MGIKPVPLIIIENSRTLHKLRNAEEIRGDIDNARKGEVVGVLVCVCAFVDASG